MANCRILTCAFAASVLLLGQAARVHAQDFVWARGIGGSESDAGLGVAVDSSGNVYTVGCFEGTVDFDPGAGTENLISEGSDEIFVSKLDSDGNFVWAVRMGGTSVDRATAVAVDSSGNVYTVGRFSGTADFNPHPVDTFPLTSSGGSADIFVSKLDSDGDFVWARAMGGMGPDQANGVALDGSGNVYTAGSFQVMADFDPGAATADLTSAGLDDIFVSKLDSGGNFLWAGAMGGMGDDEANGVAVDSSDDVYTVGRFEVMADFDPGAATSNLTSAGADDIFVSKLDSSGTFAWAGQMGGTGVDEAFGVALDSAGNVYSVGHFGETADFDPGAGAENIMVAGSRNVFVSKLNGSGGFVWARAMGGLFEQAFGVALDADSNVHSVGFFFGTADFDPGPAAFNLTSAGVLDVFVSKLDSDGDFVSARAMGGSSSDQAQAVALDGGSVYTAGRFNGTADFDPDPATTFNLTSAGGDDIFVSKLGAPVSVGPAQFLLIDEDSIDNGNPPNFFTDTEVNDHIAEVGVRTQLPFFAANGGNTITLHTGQVGDEGWFALKTIPDSWADTDPTDDGLLNYLGAGPGLGGGSDPEGLLDKVPDVTPLRAAGLKALEGQPVCAVVYDSDISINYDPLDGSLKGANLGRVAFEVISVTALTGWSSSTLPQVDIKILNAVEVCAGPLELFTDAPEPESSSEPFDVEP